MPLGGNDETSPAARGPKIVPQVQSSYGSTSSSQYMNRHDPPLTVNGCARVTPILSQRFGPNFARRYTQPNGASFPVGPHSDTRNPHRVFPVPNDLPPVTVPSQRTQSQPPPMYYRRQPSVPPATLRDVVAHNMALQYMIQHSQNNTAQQGNFDPPVALNAPVSTDAPAATSDPVVSTLPTLDSTAPVSFAPLTVLDIPSSTDRSVASTMPISAVPTVPAARVLPLCTVPTMPVAPVIRATIFKSTMPSTSGPPAQPVPLTLAQALQDVPHQDLTETLLEPKEEIKDEIIEPTLEPKLEEPDVVTETKYEPVETVAKPRTRDLRTPAPAQSTHRDANALRKETLLNIKNGDLKNMALDEFRSSFPHGTSVKDILCSGWYKDTESGKYVMGTEINARPTRRTSGARSRSSVPVLPVSLPSTSAARAPRSTTQHRLLPVKVQLSSQLQQQQAQMQQMQQQHGQMNPNPQQQHLMYQQQQQMHQHYVQNPPQPNQQQQDQMVQQPMPNPSQFPMGVPIPNQSGMPSTNQNTAQFLSEVQGQPLVQAQIQAQPPQAPSHMNIQHPAQSLSTHLGQISNQIASGQLGHQHSIQSMAHLFSTNPNPNGGPMSAHQSLQSMAQLLSQITNQQSNSSLPGRLLTPHLAQLPNPHGYTQLQLQHGAPGHTQNRPIQHGQPLPQTRLPRSQNIIPRQPRHNAPNPPIQNVPLPAANDPRNQLSTRDFLAQSQNMNVQNQHAEMLRQNAAPPQITTPTRLPPGTPQSDTQSAVQKTPPSAPEPSINRLGALSAVDHAKNRLTPTASRSLTPNILRKHRSTEGAASPMRGVDHFLYGSVLNPSAQATPVKINQLPSTSDAVEAPSSVPDTPRKRERKQKLVSDHHYQSSHLYSLLQDDPKPEMQKDPGMEPGLELAFFMKKDPELPSTSSAASLNTALAPEPETNAVQEIMEEIKEDVVIEFELPQKKPRGRPRKNQAQNIAAARAQPRPPPKQPKKPRTNYKREVASVAELIQTEPENDEEAEKERKALLQALPTNLLDAIEAQKVMDKVQLFEKKPRRLSKKAAAKLANGEMQEEPMNPIAASLQFLQAITTMDPAMLFAGLNPGMLNQQTPAHDIKPPATTLPMALQQLVQHIPPEILQSIPHLLQTPQVQQALVQPTMQPAVQPPTQVPDQLLAQQSAQPVQLPSINPLLSEPVKKSPPKKQVTFADSVPKPVTTDSSFASPTATVLATSGTPLILNLFESTPKIVEAPIWTDESGPLVPSSMYQEEKKVKSILKSPVTVDETPSTTYKPKIVTKAALKFVEEPKKPQEKTELPQPPPPWKSVGVRKKAPSLLKMIEIKEPKSSSSIPKVAQKPKKVVRVKRTQEFYDKKLAVSMRNYLVRLEKFNKSLNNNLSINGKRKTTSYPVLEDIMFSKKINEKFDEIVMHCQSAKFENEHCDNKGIIKVKTGDGIETLIEIDGDIDEGSFIYPTWHEKMTLQCVKQAIRAIVGKKEKEIESLIKKFARRIEIVRDPSTFNVVQNLAGRILEIYDNLPQKCNQFLKNYSVTLVDSFKMKLKAVEARQAKWVKIKNSHRENTVEEHMKVWDYATYSYMDSWTQPERNRKTALMVESQKNLEASLTLNDAYVDVCMYLTRLQVLYFHAHGVYSRNIDHDESLKVMQCLEDTEMFLYVAETRVKLLEAKDFDNAKWKYINIYMEADKYNVEKNKLNRLMATDNKSLIEICEIKFATRIHNFKEALMETSHLGALDCLPDPQIVGLTKVLKYELIDNEYVKEFIPRVSFFVENEDPNHDESYEIPAKLFAEITLDPLLTQMLVELPQTTNIIDEKILETAEAEKAEPRLLLQAIAPMYKRMDENCRQNQRRLKSLRKKKDVTSMEIIQRLEMNCETDKKVMKLVRENVAKLGTVIHEGEIKSYNSASHDEEQLQGVIQNTLNTFRKRKREQSAQRRKLIKKSKLEIFKDDEHRKETAIKRKLEKEKKRAEQPESGKIDYDNLEFGIRYLPRKRNPDSESESEPDSDPESEPDQGEFSIESIVAAIRELTKIIYTTDDEGKRRDLQKLLKFRKGQYQDIQKTKREERSQRCQRVRAVDKLKISKEFDIMIMDLEEYPNYEIDEAAHEEREAARMEQIRLRELQELSDDEEVDVETLDEHPIKLTDSSKRENECNRENENPVSAEQIDVLA